MDEPKSTEEKKPNLLSVDPKAEAGSVDVTGVVPADVHVDPYVTEGQPGYDETAPSELRLRARTDE